MKLDLNFKKDKIDLDFNLKILIYYYIINLFLIYLRFLNNVIGL